VHWDHELSGGRPPRKLSRCKHHWEDAAASRRTPGEPLSESLACQSPFLTPCAESCYGADRMRRPLRNILLFVLVLAVLGGLVYRSRGAITLEGFSWERLGEALRHARLDLLILSVVGIYVCYFLRTLRWVRFSRYLGEPSVRRVFAATLMGFTAIFLLGRAGEPVRPLLIARREGFTVSSMFGVYVIERVFDMASTAVLASFALVFLPALLVASGGGGGPFLSLLQKTGAVILAGLLVAIGLLCYLRFAGGRAAALRVEAWKARPDWRAKVAGLFGGFLEGLQAIRTGTDLLVAVALTTAHWLLILWIYHWVPRSFGGQLSALDLRAAVLVLACTMMGSTLQLPGVGGGSQLACFLAMTLFLGVDKEPAAAAAIMLWLVTFTSCGLVGIPLLVHEGLSLGELRRIAREEREAEAAGKHIADASARRMAP
jgi:uncharacterized protein (TIRG00374 family)